MTTPRWISAGRTLLCLATLSWALHDAAACPGAAHEHAGHDSSAAPATRGINPHTGKVDPNSGVELIGTPAPAWSFERWVRGGPLTVRGLHGKVVLVRWWTEGCHFCRTTLPVLEKLRQQHPNDLVVIGVFHPKPPRAVDNKHVLGLAKQMGFNGPIALDQQWSTLERYWLDADPDRSWTSVSFLIDRDGRIAWVHGGGEYHPTDDPRHARCDADFRELERALERTLDTRTSNLVR